MSPWTWTSSRRNPAWVTSRLRRARTTSSGCVACSRSPRNAAAVAKSKVTSPRSSDVASWPGRSTLREKSGTVVLTGLRGRPSGPAGMTANVAGNTDSQAPTTTPTRGSPSMKPRTLTCTRVMRPLSPSLHPTSTPPPWPRDQGHRSRAHAPHLGAGRTARGRGGSRVTGRDQQPVSHVGEPAFVACAAPVLFEPLLGFDVDPVRARATWRSATASATARSPSVGWAMRDDLTMPRQLGAFPPTPLPSEPVVRIHPRGPAESQHPPGLGNVPVD